MQEKYTNSEIVIALSYAVGTDRTSTIKIIKEQLKEYNYDSELIQLSKEALEPLISEEDKKQPFNRAKRLMDVGNELRQKTKNNAILSCAAVNIIQNMRKEKNPEATTDLPQIPKTAFIINSIKNPDEVVKLREIYPTNFFLFAINESEESRLKNLNKKNIGNDDAKFLIKRDANENLKYGQHTRDVFEMADFHLTLNNRIKDAKFNKENSIKRQISRVLDLIFGNPFITPTFDEYAMFIAYSSSLRSADLGRQVGAVIANEYNEIISTGANEVPSFGGGQYWPDPISYEDIENGRDYTRGGDANKREHRQLINEIVDMYKYNSLEDEETFRSRLTSSSIKYLTEYGRAVHAEMSAILSCSRSGISLHNATLYCSTFPCHNCAKHIIYSGIKRVVYIEPYPKSKTFELYDDSTSMVDAPGKVLFEEFVGIGPRKFFDLFSLKLSSGRTIIRKDKIGEAIKWERSKSRLRFQAVPISYIEKESIEKLKWILATKQIQEESTNESDDK